MVNVNRKYFVVWSKKYLNFADTMSSEAEEEPAAKKQKVDEAAVGDSYPKNDEEIWKSQTWTHPDGTVEDIIEVEDEPRHNIDFVNDHTKIITIKFPPGDTTLAHRHEYDTIIVILMKDGIDFINCVLGTGPQKGHMDFGQVGFAPFTAKPCVHTITNLSDDEMFCINIEVHNTPSLVQEAALDLPRHSLLMTQYNCRVYSLKLEPGEKVTVTYSFFYVRVIVHGGKVKVAHSNGEGMSWEESHKVGESLWKDPCSNIQITNVGDELYEAYICEYR